VSKQQRRVFLTLGLIGLVYFSIFIIPNSYGAGNMNILLQASADEYVTYPNVLQILTIGKTFLDERANLFLYEDYHYGYPFYALSSLVLVPQRIILGRTFIDHLQLNMLVLRQMISLLPMLLAAGIMVYLFTRFQSMAKSVALFVFLLTIRGVVRNHIWWWHPDALAVLSVVLTIFFLDRDQLRFGKNFYLAAAFCGLAIAIKLLGAFFFLTIPVYLLIGLGKKQITLPRAILSAVLFVLVMAAVSVFSNPFLFSTDQRERMLQIQAEKQEELSKGYSHDDPIYYSKGPQWWVTTLEKWYAPAWFLGLLVLSIVAGCIWGNRRLLNIILLTWIVPYSIYLLYFVAVKPDHYWLPVMLPLFSGAINGVDILWDKIGQSGKAFFARELIWQKVVCVLLVVLFAGQVVWNVARPASGNLVIYQSAVEGGMAKQESLLTNP
jgi:4-amino-4-deoxy-L-arabinose transferase-like glycosyltransferase